MVVIKSLGQVAYEAYRATTQWKSLISGALLPKWDIVKPEIKEAWEAAGRAIHDVPAFTIENGKLSAIFYE